MTSDDAIPVIDTTRAHPARIYDYWLGGKDNFAADREAGELPAHIAGDWRSVSSVPAW